MTLIGPQARVARCLEAAGEGITVATVSAPARPAASVLAALGPHGGSSALAWLPPEGIQLVGLGVAASVQGVLGTPALAGRAAELLRSIRTVDSGQEALAAPRLIGGFAFGRRRTLAAPWEHFGPGLLVLPRWTYAREESRAWLSLAVRGPLTSPERGRALAELAALLAALEPLPSLSSESHQATGEEIEAGVQREAAVCEAHETDAGAVEWAERIAAIGRAIEGGAAAKVVAARCEQQLLPGHVQPALVLRRLARRFGSCTAFSLEIEGAVFLGATPERLLRVSGREVTTEALAGSAPPARAAGLLESSKELQEHAFVRDDIVARLAPLCDEVRQGDLELRMLPNIAHLRTGIRATARKDAGVLDLLAALHPTPAVGGVPREAALRWIEEHEPLERGWYAGPFGWLDAEGDGEFVVALRSAMLRDGKAWLYAGAGIVRGSDPSAEWAETAAKLEPMRRSLAAAAGVSGEAGAGETATLAKRPWHAAATREGSMTRHGGGHE